MPRRTRLALIAAMLAQPALAAEAPGFDPRAVITDAVLRDIRTALSNEIVQVAVEAQNERYGDLAPTAIATLDAQWVAERESEDKPLIAATLANPLSTYLVRVQGASLGAYAEIFVMDRNGLNVGQSSITSDFWQGDEAKYTESVTLDGDGYFLDTAEWEEARGIWIAQLSLPLRTPEGALIGAATFDLNLTELARPGALAH